MDDVDKETAKHSERINNEMIEVDSETVKVVKIPGSTLMKAYYWKKEDVTFLAIGQIGVEKRPGDQTNEIQEEYAKPETDQMLKIIAAMIKAQESIKKN